MSHDFEPVVGHWYRYLDKGQGFAVVALDDSQALVEIQHYDGDVEEIDFDSWYEMEIEPTVAPKDWVGPLDDIEFDDLDYTDSTTDDESAQDGDEYPQRPEEWSNDPEAREAAERDSEDSDASEEGGEDGSDAETSLANR